MVNTAPGNIQIQVNDGGFNKLNAGVDGYISSKTHAMTAGINAWMLGVEYAAMDNLTVSAVVGVLRASDVVNDRNISKDMGSEYDIKIIWKPFDNLTYTAIAAYFHPGPFYHWGLIPWESPLDYSYTEELEPCFSLFHSLELNF